MTRLADFFANLFAVDPPTAPPTRLITVSTPPPLGRLSSIHPSTARTGGLAMSNRMTKETLRQIIDSVELDPLAGQGYFTKKDILIDRLLAHWNTVDRPAEGQVKTPAPIVTEVVKPTGTPLSKAQPARTAAVFENVVAGSNAVKTPS